jgi:hypothetical protein
VETWGVETTAGQCIGFIMMGSGVFSSSLLSAQVTHLQVRLCPLERRFFAMLNYWRAARGQTPVCRTSGGEGHHARNAQTLESQTRDAGAPKLPTGCGKETLTDQGTKDQSYTNLSVCLDERDRHRRS